MIDLSAVVAFFVGIVLGPMLVVAVLILLVMRSSRKRSGDSELSPPEIPGRIVSLDFDVRDMDDQQIKLEQLRVGRPMFLNFWATWCGPCKQEMSSIQELYDTLGDQLAVACVSQEDKETLQNFMKEKAYSFPIYRIETSPDGFDARGIPATFLLSSDREILLQHVGAANWAHASVIDFIRDLSASRSGGVVDGHAHTTTD